MMQSWVQFVLKRPSTRKGAFPSSPSPCGVPALDTETGNYAMEDRIIIVAALYKRLEICAGFWCVRVVELQLERPECSKDFNYGCHDAAVALHQKGALCNPRRSSFA